jgi:hypothetical protein
MFSDVPSLFILFILSHGNTDGRIETDEKILMEGREHYDNFTTETVIKALKNNDALKDAVKLVFFGVSFLRPKI